LAKTHARSPHSLINAYNLIVADLKAHNTYDVNEPTREETDKGSDDENDDASEDDDESDLDLDDEPPADRRVGKHKATEQLRRSPRRKRRLASDSEEEEVSLF
jgi:hypothetical protein